MSLVSTYVRATDNKWYRDPVLSGEDWFVCFDDDDPVELVIEVRNRTRKQLQKRVQEVLEELKLEYSLESKLELGAQRDFSRTEKKFRFKPAAAVFFEISKGRIPVEKITNHDGSFVDRPKGECVFYDL